VIAASSPGRRRARRADGYAPRPVPRPSRARGRAGDELLVNVDRPSSACARWRPSCAPRAEDEASDWQSALQRASEDMRRESGRLALRAQRTPEALTAMSTEIRRRKSQLH
jgi:hypothetical protein